MEATGDKQLQGSYITQELLKELNKVGNRLLIGIPCERKEGEKRLALTPEAVDMLTDRGHRVLVESGAGLGINYSDNHYSEAGAEIVATPAEVFQADIILKILTSGNPVDETSFYCLLYGATQSVCSGSF